MPKSSHMMISRRRVLAGTFGTGLAVSLPALGQTRPRVAALFAGRVDDHGFMEAGYRGLVAAHERFDCPISWRAGVKPDRASLEAALRELAAGSPSLVVAHGGQNNEAAKAVASDHPGIAFVVTQGAVTGANLASYEVLQEQSAFLAGCLAAWSTTSGVVGHMSGIRVLPGLKGRAAYANGVAYADPKVRLLTNFSGSQDDEAVARRVVVAMADAGADVIFTMLNAGRGGAVEACRERKVAQIGNVVDWVGIASDVFIGSAVADSGLAVFSAVQDVVEGRFRPNTVKSIGLENADAVRLTVGEAVSPPTVARVGQITQGMVTGAITVSTEWTGPEFATPT